MNPTYRNHPGHAEAVRIEYDENVTSFRELLVYFYRIHNPTTLNQQGNDKGSSYRSAIFYQNDEEYTVSQEVVDMVNTSGRWDDPVVTTLEKFSSFWNAEEMHQDYLQKNPSGYTCHVEHVDKY